MSTTGYSAYLLVLDPPPAKLIPVSIMPGGTVIPTPPATVNTAKLQVARGRLTGPAPAGPTDPTMPAGYTPLQSFIPPGGTWVDGLRVASGKVWIPKNPDDPDGVYYFDAAWKQVLLDPSKPASLNNLDYSKSVLKSLIVGQLVTDLDGENVRLEMRPFSSLWPKETLGPTGPWGYATTPVTTLEQTNGRLRYVGRGITLVCSQQGHCYHGFSLWKPKNADGTRIVNGYFGMSVEGGEGYGGNPPIETFQSAFKECVGWTFDGHIGGYNPDGTQTACVGMTCQESPGFKLGPNSYFEDQLASSFVAYQTPDWRILPGARIKRDAVNEAAWGSGCFVNVERSPGGYIEGEFIGGSVADDVHVSFAGDEQWTLNSQDPVTGAPRTWTGHDQRVDFGPGFKMTGPKLWRNGSDGRPVPTVRVWAIETKAGDNPPPMVNGRYWRYSNNPIGVYTTSTWKDSTGTMRQVHVVCYGVHTMYTDARQMPAGTTP